MKLKPIKIKFWGITITIGAAKLKEWLLDIFDNTINWNRIEAEISQHVGSAKAALIVNWLRHYLRAEIEAV